MDEYLGKVRKLLEHQTDTRFKDLQNHNAEVRRLLVAIQNGKRLNHNQAALLLTHLGRG